MRRFFVFLLPVLLAFSCKPKPGYHGTDGGGGEATENSSVQKENISQKELLRYKQVLAVFFDSLLVKRGFNGGILVAKGGNILYESYIGFENPHLKKDTITPETTFHLASTSKPFTGVAILRLVQDGKIGLEDDIIKYFPGFPYSGITVKDLLSHRSGLPNYLYFMEDKTKWDANAMVTNKDVLDFLIKYQPPVNYKPGTRFSYCNTNFVLLALLVEKVTGTPFPRYMHESIFNRLGMKNTFVFTPADSNRVLMSYKPSGAVWANDKFEYTYGDKNVYSTPRDMLKWDSALYSNDFISQAMLDSSFVPRSVEKPSIHNYGLGWRLLNLKNGKNVTYHFGKWHGFTPAFARLIDEKAVIIILGNKFNNNIYEAAKHSYDFFGSYMQSEPSVDEDDAQPISNVDESQIKKSEKIPVPAPAKVNNKTETIPAAISNPNPNKKIVLKPKEKLPIKKK